MNFLINYFHLIYINIATNTYIHKHSNIHTYINIATNLNLRNP